jgi:hypothetical protein
LCACAMTTNVHTVGQRTRKQPGAEQAAAVARTPAPHPVLALQRTAGNRAVNALIARRPPRADEESLLEPEYYSPAQGEAPAVQAPATNDSPRNDIHFAPGQMDDELLGHEAWHVRQQRQGRVF